MSYDSYKISQCYLDSAFRVYYSSVSTRNLEMILNVVDTASINSKALVTVVEDCIMKSIVLIYTKYFFITETYKIIMLLCTGMLYSYLMCISNFSLLHFLFPCMRSSFIVKTGDAALFIPNSTFQHVAIIQTKYIKN